MEEFAERVLIRKARGTQWVYVWCYTKPSKVEVWIEAWIEREALICCIIKLNSCTQRKHVLKLK